MPLLEDGRLVADDWAVVADDAPLPSRLPLPMPLLLSPASTPLSAA